MNTPSTKRSFANGYTFTVALAVSSLLLVTGIVMFPEPAFQASLQGLSLWWDIVFPAMLPFLILSEIMIAFGVMHFFGVLLDPIMRKGLNLPGHGSWALSMSMMSGYPAGARTTVLMREKKWIFRKEGERLLAYSYLCSPVFVISVVAVGFFHNAALGWILLGLHLGSWLVTAIVFRSLFWRGTANEDRSIQTQPGQGSVLRRALLAMEETRQEDGRSFGKLMGDAVTAAIQMMLMIGGYMMLFSVIMEILSVSGIIPLLVQGLQTVCYTFGIPANLIQPLLTGLVEIHLGTHASSGSNVPPAWQAAATGAVMAWGGWSAHAQVKSLASSTDLSLVPYLQFRLTHSLAAFVLTLLLWNTLLVWFSRTTPSTVDAAPITAVASPVSIPNLWLSWPEALSYGAVAFIALACGSLLVRLFSVGRAS